MKYIALLLGTLALLIYAISVHAQMTPAGFVASSDVLAIDCNGGWGAGNFTPEAYDFLDYGSAKSNRIFAQGIEMTAPSCGLSVFGGGLIWQPDISKLLAKSNVPMGNVLTFLDASVGNGISSVGSNRVSAVLGGGFKYILTDNLTWNTVRCEAVFFGASRYPACSTGIAAYWGGTPASPAISSNVKKGLLKRIQSAQQRLGLLK
ncbi:MAG: hypothetical protein ABSC47_09050 [Terracidiphilus sp.]|jgi:hypothetical protein